MPISWPTYAAHRMLREYSCLRCSSRQGVGRMNLRSFYKSTGSPCCFLCHYRPACGCGLHALGPFLFCLQRCILLRNSRESRQKTPRACRLSDGRAGFVGRACLARSTLLLLRCPVGEAGVEAGLDRGAVHVAADEAELGHAVAADRVPVVEHLGVLQQDL